MITTLVLALALQGPTVPPDNQRGVWRTADDNVISFTRTRGAFNKDGIFGYTGNWWRQPGGTWVAYWLMTPAKSSYLEGFPSLGALKIGNLGLAKEPDGYTFFTGEKGIIPATSSSFGEFSVNWGAIGGAGYARSGTIYMAQDNHPPVFRGNINYLGTLDIINCSGSFKGQNVSVEVQEGQGQGGNVAIEGTINIPGVNGLHIKGLRVGARTAFEATRPSTGLVIGRGVLDWTPSPKAVASLAEGKEIPTDRVAISVAIEGSGPPTGYQCYALRQN